jgi:anthranilate synthase component 2
MVSLLVVDNHDSFTFTLVDYLTTLGARVEVVQSNAISVEHALAQPVDGYVLSPGPGRPEEAGISVGLAKACIDGHRPLLGVCLGHQAIGLACGAEVIHEHPVHGKAVKVRHDDSGLFAGLPSPMKVVRYNSLSVQSLPPTLKANAWESQSIQGLCHVDAPVHGVQFHPESIASEYGRELLANFIGQCS